MEPFLARDGKYLFFNNLNEPSVNTNLYWAEPVDDLTFQLKGEIGGVNTPALEGVASIPISISFRREATTRRHRRFIGAISPTAVPESSTA